MRTHKLMLHRLIVIWVVMSMLIVQASPALAVVQKTVIDIQEQLFGMSTSFTAPVAYIPPTTLTIDDRLFHVSEEFPEYLKDDLPELYGEGFPITPTPTPTTTPPPPSGGGYTYATRILDQKTRVNGGYIINPTHLLGENEVPIPLETNFNHGCVVVSFDGYIETPTHILVWFSDLAGHVPLDPRKMPHITASYSDYPLSCDDNRWVEAGFARFGEEPDAQPGRLPEPMRFPRHNQSLSPSTVIRSVKIEIYQYGDVEAIALRGGSFVPEDIDDVEPPGGEADCNPCMDSDTESQAQEEVGEPIDVRTGMYTYGTDDITIQGIIEPITFRRRFINGTGLPADYYRSLRGSFGPGWTYDYNSYLLPYPTVQSFADVPVTSYNPNNIDELSDLANTFTPHMIFVARTGSIHTLLKDGDVVDGVQKWKFDSGFLAQLEEYVNNITLDYPGYAPIPNVRYRLILRNQTVQYYNQDGALVAVSQRHDGTETVRDTNNLPVSQELLNPVVFYYQTFQSNPSLYRLISIEAGSNRLDVSYVVPEPATMADLRINVITEYNGATVGRQVEYTYETLSIQTKTRDINGVTDQYENVEILSAFKDVMGGIWEYDYVKIVPEPTSTNTLIPGTNKYYYTYTEDIRLAVVRSPNILPNLQKEIIEDTSYCSYNTGSLTNGYSFSRSAPSQKIRYGQPNVSAPATCAPGRAYRQYNGAGELTITLNYLYRENYHASVVIVTEGTGTQNQKRYRYNNSAIVAIDVWQNGRWEVYSQDTRTPNYRPTSSTDQRGNTSDYVWSADGDNLIREVTRGTGLPEEGVIRSTNIYNHDFNRLDVGVDALNRVTNYDYTDTNFPTLPTGITRPRLEPIIPGQPAPIPTSTTGTTFTYTSAGLLDTLTDENGVLTCYKYNGQAQRTKIIVNCDNTTKEAKAGNLSQVTEFAYDSQGRMVTTITPDGVVTGVVYDARNNITKIITNYVGTPTLDYNYVTCNLSDTAVDNICTHYGYDLNGRLNSKIDTFGRITRYEYDNAGRLAREILNDVDGIFNHNEPDFDVWTSYTYDSRGNVVSITIPVTSNTDTRTDRLCYDAQNRLTRYIKNHVSGSDFCGWTTSELPIDNVFNDTNLLILYEYNPNSTISLIVTDPLGRRTAYCADALDRTTRIVQNINVPNLNTLCAETTTRSISTSDQNLITDFVYDDKGNVRSVFDPLNRETRYFYDQFGRVVAQVGNAVDNEHDFGLYDELEDVEPQVVGAEDILNDTDIITKFYYDDSGNLQGIVDQNARLTWVCYNDLKQATRIVSNLYLDSFAYNYYNTIGYGTAQQDLENLACQTTLVSSSTADTNIVTTVIYDSIGRPVEVTNPLNQKTRMIYDTLGRTTAVIHNYVDGAGGVTGVDVDITSYYEYDSLGNLIKMIAPDGFETRYSYDELNRQTGIIHNYVDGVSGDFEFDTDITETIQYDGLGRIYRTTNAEGVTTQFAYDKIDRLITYYEDINGFNQNLAVNTQLRYDIVGRLVRVTNPLGHSVTYTYDLADRQTSIFSPLGNTTRVTYDIGGRMTEQTDANGRVNKYTYDLMNRLRTSTENFITDIVSNDTNIQTIYQYDVIGNLRKITAPSNATITYSYDRMDRQIANDGLDYEGEFFLGVWQTAYDVMSRPIAMLAPNGTITSFVYDGMNRVTNINYIEASGVSNTPDVAYTYDVLGRRTRMTETTSVSGVATDVNITDYNYDNLSRIQSVQNKDYDLINQTDILQKFVNYDYDKLGRRTQLTMDNDVVSPNDAKMVIYDYDTRNRLTQVTGWDSKNTVYDYDNGNRLKQMTLPNSVSARYEYDNDSRLIALAYKEPNSLLTDVYSYTYNSVGLRTEANESVYNLVATIIPNRELREELTRLVAEDEAGDILYVMPYEGTHQFVSDQCGTGDVCFRVDVVAMVTPDPNTGQTTPVEVSDFVEFKLVYQNPNDQNTIGEQALTLQALPRQFASTTTDENLSKLVYERIAPMVYRAYDNVLTRLFGATYDVQQIIETNFDLFMALLGTDGVEQSQSSQRISYTYDGLYRLIGANYVEGGIDTRSYAYSYDVMGNRISDTVTLQGVTPVTTLYEYEGSGQLKTRNGVDIYSYNSNGNLIDDGAYTYEYNASNRLTKITNKADSANTYTYAYNGDGDRTSQTINTLNGSNTIDYLLDVNTGLTQVLGEFRAGDDTWYLHGLDIIAQDNSTDGWGYFGYDALGSVRAIYDQTGELQTTNEYDPFGIPLPANGVDSTLGFAGEQTDGSGLIYLRARYMNPTTGTFITTDPVQGVVGMAGTWNPYPYAHNNPVNYTDPSGEFAWMPFLFQAFGAAAKYIGSLLGHGLISALLDALIQRLMGAEEECLDLPSIAASFIEGALAAALKDIFGLAGAGRAASIIATFIASMFRGLYLDRLPFEEAFGQAVLASGFDIFIDGMTGDLFDDGGTGRRGRGRGRAGDIDSGGGGGRDINGNNNSGSGGGKGGGNKPPEPTPNGNSGSGNLRFNDRRGNVRIDGDNRVPSNHNCSFAPETLVIIEDGEKPISEIEVGDMVLAYNEETGEIGEYPVTHVWSHDDDNLLTLTIDGEVIITTTDHPFYTADGEWIAAGDLQIGTEVYSADGTHGTLDALVITDGTAWVYNLTVDEAHTYFVGDGQWLVHNVCKVTRNPNGGGGGGGNNNPHSNSYQWTETKKYSRQGNATEHWITHKNEFPSEYNMTRYIQEANSHIQNPNAIRGIDSTKPDTGVIYIPEGDYFVFYRLSDNLPRSYHKFDPSLHPGMTAKDYFTSMTGIVLP